MVARAEVALMVGSVVAVLFALGLVVGGLSTTRNWTNEDAGGLLMLSYYFLAAAVVFYPWPIANAIDRVTGVVDLAHLLSMFLVSVTLVFMSRFGRAMNETINPTRRVRAEWVGYGLTACYVVVWLAARATLRETDAMFADSYYANPPLIGLTNVLAGVTFAVAGSAASYGLWTVPRTTRIENIIISALSVATAATVVYGLAIIAQVAINVGGGDPQAIHRYMVPLGLGGVAVAVVGSLILTDGLRLSSSADTLLQRLIPARPNPVPVHDPNADEIHYVLMIDDRHLAAGGADMPLLEIVDRRCREHGMSEEHIMMTVEATRIAILDPVNGTRPYDRTVQAVAYIANRNNRFFGGAYRIALATLGPSALPIGSPMPNVEPWHEELAVVIRESVYERYSFDRGRAILMNKGLVTVGSSSENRPTPSEEEGETCTPASLS